MLTLSGCAEITPADPTGNEDAGDHDAGGEHEPDGSPAGATCDYDAAGDSDKRVHVVYMVPSDREEDPLYTANLEQAARHAQQWIRNRLPAAKHFSVTSPVVQVVKTAHTASWYASNVNGEGEDIYFWNNTLADAASVGATLDDPDDVWLLYIAADPACGQVTNALRNVALMPENDLRGLAGIPRPALCDGAPDSYGRCRWVGGMALQLAHALGVPSDLACYDDDDATPCDTSGLLYLGFLTYPAASLTEAQVGFLEDNPFMQASGLPLCDLDCAAVVQE